MALFGTAQSEGAIAPHLRCSKQPRLAPLDALDPLVLPLDATFGTFSEAHRALLRPVRRSLGAPDIPALGTNEVSSFRAAGLLTLYPLEPRALCPPELPTFGPFEPRTLATLRPERSTGLAPLAAASGLLTLHPELGPFGALVPAAPLLLALCAGLVAAATAAGTILLRERGAGDRACHQNGCDHLFHRMQLLRSEVEPRKGSYLNARL